MNKAAAAGGIAIIGGSLVAALLLLKVRGGSDCPEGYTGTPPNCVAPDCTSNAQCPSTYIDGVRLSECSGGKCQCPDVCPNGYTCQGSSCAPKPCLPTCAPGQICHLGECQCSGECEGDNQTGHNTCRRIHGPGWFCSSSAGGCTCVNENECDPISNPCSAGSSCVWNPATFKYECYADVPIDDNVTLTITIRGKNYPTGSVTDITGYYIWLWQGDNSWKKLGPTATFDIKTNLPWYVVITSSGLPTPPKWYCPEAQGGTIERTTLIPGAAFHTQTHNSAGYSCP